MCMMDLIERFIDKPLSIRQNSQEPFQVSLEKEGENGEKMWVIVARRVRMYDGTTSSMIL